MDWSAVFAGIAAMVSVAGLAYSSLLQRKNKRIEFIIWAVEQYQSKDQIEARGLIYRFQRNAQEKHAFIKGIISGDEEILNSDDYIKIRSSMALFDYIGYFYISLGYGKLEDVEALFPQAVNLWNISYPIIQAIRSRPSQEMTFKHFEEVVEKMRLHGIIYE